jgi:hypothetical protein
MLIITHGMIGKSRRRSWMTKSEEVELYELNFGEMIYMCSITGRKNRNAIVPRHDSLTDCAWELIRHQKPMKRLDPNENKYIYKT